MSEHTPTHSPTPWVHEPEKLYQGQHVAGRGPKILDANGELVADVASFFTKSVGHSETNAAFIVRAVNAHEALVAACQRAIDLFDHDDATSVLEWVNSPEFRAALALAKPDAAKGGAK